MNINHFYPFLDSEWSDECIDFTMIRNNAPISNFGGGFRCKSEYPWCIIEVKSIHFPTVFKKIEKNKKKRRKRGIFMQNQFSTKSIFLYGCNSRTNHCKYMKFSPNVYVSVIYIQFYNPFDYLLNKNVVKSVKFESNDIGQVTFSNSFKKNREKQKKNDGKTGIFTQNQFSTKSIFFYGCNSKTNH
ncbi:Uncharacterized protein FWK35_00002041 [Aphis craccivora]|uniref:Uncharacterized protein n=1 Tax=Aphis craccivora TaxID=307492 RepID=A0A6G0ZPJ6_APHCR|nr:Uncharacterized protein FWK35_00002041 [Aphis craccivora]